MTSNDGADTSLLQGYQQMSGTDWLYAIVAIGIGLAIALPLINVVTKYPSKGKKFGR